MEQTGFSDFYYASPDGLKLHARTYGPTIGDRVPVVCLPGLTRNARDFHQLALFLSQDAANPRQVICFDYRGRGLSDYDADWKNYDVRVEATDILAGLQALGIEKAAFIGTSRGGLILHVLAAIRPDVLKAVILNDIGPVLEPDGLALIKSYLSAPATTPSSFEDVARMHKAVHGSAFPALVDDDWLDMAHATYREIDGRLRPDFDPKLLNVLAAFDLSKPIPTLWPQFDAMTTLPMMVIRGETSLLLAEQTVEEMKKRHPMLEAITVPGQGHAPFLHIAALEQRIGVFVSKTE